MPVVVVTPPAPIITLAEAKQHLRIDDFDNDVVIAGLVAAAIATIDGPDGRLGRAIGLQTLEEQRHAFPYSFCPWERMAVPHWCRHDRRFIVQVPPIVSLNSVSYVDVTGEPQTIDVSTLLNDATAIEPPEDWPECRYALGSVKVRYQAGYAAVPPALKAAALLILGTLYENRECATAGDFSGAVGNLLAPYRVCLA